MNLPDLDDLFPLNPVGEFERFLLQPLHEDPNHIYEFAYVLAQITTQVSQLQAECARMKLEKAKEFAFEQYRLTQERDPQTESIRSGKKEWKRYSLEGAARVIERMPSQIHYSEQIIEHDRKIHILRGYLRAMEVKARVMPGEQGRINQLIRGDGRT